jgi:hypothetical protein
LNELASIAPTIAGAWAVVGDFNLIRQPVDKSSATFDQHEANLFNAAIDTLCLMEIPLLDRLYTWTNNQSPPTLVRLDRALVNTAWNSLLPDTSLSSVTRTTSDHVPLILPASSIPHPSIFCFSNHWLASPTFSPIVTTNWLSVHNNHQRASSATAALCLCLKRVRSAARSWAKSQRPLDVLIANCELVISLLDHLEERRHLSYHESLLRTLVHSLLSRLCSQRATFWQQRGKVRQCILGDENTAYHHQCATIRLQKNKIRSLIHNGLPVFSHSGKASVLHDFYKDLLGTPAPSPLSFDLNSLFITSSLDSAQPASLVLPFDAAEIRLALLGMNSNASPGPDGFGLAFFKHFWDLTKDNLTSFLSDFHLCRSDLKRINKSYIVLLPKKSAACQASDYRLISLQNTSNKIASKALTSRLQPFIPDLIHDDQTGFIKGCSISENFVYAADIIQTCHKHKLPVVVLKLDFRKAFDSISWLALDQVLDAKGFPPLWRH